MKQRCPNCEKVHDVTIYVTGQRLRCGCGISFEVRRTDVSGVTVNLQRRRSSLPELQIQGSAALQPEPSLPPAPANEAISQPVIVEKAPTPAEAQAPDRGLDDTVITASHRRPSHEELEIPPTVKEPAARTAETIKTPPKIELPGYQLERLLGRGGMGEVWRAHQRSLGRTVAVKLLPPDLAKDPEFVARFEKEATALAALSHPNIIQIIDRGVVGTHYFFVMEFVEGRSLRQLLEQGRPKVQDSLRIVSQICRAIEAAHDKQIIHRDLKPENILLDGRGHVKVADFGLAGIRGADERLQLTGTAVAMGTINYMAPEQRRDARAVDARADLFSLGVMLYELLTGELPIGRFKLPSERYSDIDPRLDVIVASALEPDPQARCPSAATLAAQLEPLIVGSGVGLGAAPESRPASGPRVSLPGMERPSAIRRGWHGLRNGLMVIGALAVIGFGVRWISGGRVAVQTPVTLTASTDEGSKVAKPSLPTPPDTNGQLTSSVNEEPLPAGRLRVQMDFGPGLEPINAHSGTWEIVGGVLKATQAGTGAGGKKVIPRAYLGEHYFSADDVSASVDVTLKDVHQRYAVDENGQRFAELSFRMVDRQVSIFAIPGQDMRLGWRYYAPDGSEVSGNSVQDVDQMVEDQVVPPQDGTTFRMTMTLKRVKDGVDVSAFLNDIRFAHKKLVGLQGQVAKIAVGCRNYHCEFDNLKVEGLSAERPPRRAADHASE